MRLVERLEALVGAAPSPGIAADEGPNPELLRLHAEALPSASLIERVARQTAGNASWALAPMHVRVATGR